MTDEILRSIPARSDDATGVTAQTVLASIFRQRWIVLTVFSAVILLAIYWMFGTSRRYTSEMVLLVQNARGNEVVTSAQGGSAPGLKDVSEEQINSEVAILKSNDLLDEVADPSWAERVKTAPAREQILQHERAVDGIRTRLDISPIRSSHAITVKIVALSPDAARDTLTQLLGAFLRKQRTLGRLPGASGVFSQQAEEYRRQLDTARRELAAYQNKQGIVSVATRESALDARVLDLQGQARDAEVQMQDLSKRIDADTVALTNIPQRQPTLERAAPASGTIDQLNLLLVTLTNRRTELLTKLKPDDRLVKEVEQQLVDTIAGIRQAKNLGPHEISTDVNPTWQSLQHDLSQNQVSVQGLRARRASLLSQASDLQKSLTGTEALSGDFEILTQRVAELETTYRNFVQKRDASRMDDLMDQQEWLNVAVVQYPTISLAPSHPKPATDIPLALFTAALLSCCAGFLMESMRETISTPAELDHVCLAPVLAIVPFERALASPKSRLAELGSKFHRSPEQPYSPGATTESQI